MKIKNNFVLRQVADTWLVMPLGEESEKLGGMLTLSESGAVLWKCLERGGDLRALAQALTAEYDVSEEIAYADATKFVDKLKQLGCIDPD